jgi:hypothetical protein
MMGLPIERANQALEPRSPRSSREPRSDPQILEDRVDAPPGDLVVERPHVPQRVAEPLGARRRERLAPLDRLRRELAHQRVQPDLLRGPLVEERQAVQRQERVVERRRVPRLGAIAHPRQEREPRRRHRDRLAEQRRGLQAEPRVGARERLPRRPQRRRHRGLVPGRQIERIDPRFVDHRESALPRQPREVARERDGGVLLQKARRERERQRQVPERPADRPRRVEVGAVVAGEHPSPQRPAEQQVERVVVGEAAHLEDGKGEILIAPARRDQDTAPELGGDEARRGRAEQARVGRVVEDQESIRVSVEVAAEREREAHAALRLRSVARLEPRALGQRAELGLPVSRRVHPVDAAGIIGLTAIGVLDRHLCLAHAPHAREHHRPDAMALPLLQQRVQVRQIVVAADEARVPRERNGERRLHARPARMEAGGGLRQRTGALRELRAGLVDDVSQPPAPVGCVEEVGPHVDHGAVPVDVLPPEPCLVGEPRDVRRVAIEVRQGGRERRGFVVSRHRHSSVVRPSSRRSPEATGPSDGSPRRPCGDWDTTSCAWQGRRRPRPLCYPWRHPGDADRARG